MATQFFTRRIRHSGFTLIELLVTVSILAVVAVVVIPTVRLLSQDRKVHDTGNMVIAAIATARERAAVDGYAGVEIAPISNELDPNVPGKSYNVPNMGMVIYQLRAIPPYSGDVNGHVATLPIGTIAEAVDEATSPGTAIVNFENGMGLLPLLYEVTPGDYIEFNYNGIRYEITSTGTQGIAIDLPFMVPPPPADSDLAFTIHRKPIRVESSTVRMPRNVFLNLAWSGYGMTGFQCRCGLAPNTPSLNPAGTVIWFNRDGSIDKVYDQGTLAMEVVDGPVFLLMCTGEGDDVDVTALGNQSYIEDDNNLWIVVDHRNGGTSLGAMAELGAAATPADRVRAARQLAKNRRSVGP